MPGAEYLVAVDQGSTSTKALLVDREGQVKRSASARLSSTYPRPGWVEQSATEILETVRTVVADVVAEEDPANVGGLCLSTQRESMVLWDESTGEPVAPLLSWQDQRGADLCRELAERGETDRVTTTTGLPLDPMFSGTRSRWLLDAVDPTRARARAGKLRLGTVDSWLLTKLTGRHLTEPGNASRTQLMHLRERKWDDQMLDLFEVPVQALPDIVPSGGAFPPVRGLRPLLDGTPMLAVLADSHAALFAHGATSAGQVKATYGTGSSVMGVCDLDEKMPAGLCSTVAWEGDRPTYAMEGNIRSSGSTFAWLAKILSVSPDELAERARKVADNGGTYFVPAFNGLGAPWWDPHARGVVSGLTLGVEAGHLARAALESIAFQIEDVLDAMTEAVGELTVLLADGGASENPDLMQIQADISGLTVEASTVANLSALGAAHFGGLVAGLWSEEDLATWPRSSIRYTPELDADARRHLRAGWADALARSRRKESG